MEQQTIPGCKLEMVLQDIRESGQRPVVAVLRGRGQEGKTVHWQLANRRTEDKRALENICSDFRQQESRNHLPWAPILSAATLAQKLLLPDSEPQSGPSPGVYTLS